MGEVFGLDPVSNCPKVYYDPKTNDDLKDTVLVSLSGVTRFVMSDAMKPIVDELIEKYQDKKVLMITHSDEIDHKTFDNFHKDGTLLIRSITDYCDALASCDVFISTHSGQSHLSSAMKRHNHNMESHCIVEESFLDIDRKKRNTHLRKCQLHNFLGRYMMKYLITGLTGFAGPHLAKQLLNDGHEVHGVVRTANGREQDLLDVLSAEEIKQITFHCIDLKRFALCVCDAETK